MLVTLSDDSVTLSTCTQTPPSSLTVTPVPLVEHDSATFLFEGILHDSSCWFVMYRDYCCDQSIGATQDSFFRYQVTDSDIFMVRIECSCDTTSSVGIDVDVYPRPTALPDSEPSFDFTIPVAPYYDGLGRTLDTPPISGWYIYRGKRYYR